jgi:hypothetical protein
MSLNPPWLYDLVAGLMLLVAAYSAVLLVLAAVLRRPAGADVEVSHLAMGIAMAGMFVARLTFGPDALWELVFGGLFVLFATRGLRSVQLFGLHLSHYFIHALMSLGMLLMYWFPVGSTRGRSIAMTMTAGASGGRVDPAVAFAIAFALFTSAIFTLASPNKGAIVYGSHQSTPTDGASTSGPASLALRTDTVSSAGGFESVVATPRLLDITHVVMAIAMGFMLVLML